MEVSRNCMRALRRHLNNAGSKGWTDRSAEMACCVEEQFASSSLSAAPAIRFASTAPTAQASEPIAQATSAPPPPPSPPPQGQNTYRTPWRNQNVSPMQRRVSQQVMGLQHKMYALMHEQKFKEAVTFFENFVNEGFREARAQKLAVGQLPIQKRPAEYQWLQYLQALNRSQNFAKSTISEAIKLMIQVGITPRAAHYQLVLYHLRRQGNSARALSVIDQMIQSGVRPNLVCYEHAIFATLANKDLDGTSMLLDSTFRTPSWRLSDIQRGQILYTKVVVYCAQLKRIENALVFMKQMQDLQMRIPVNLFLDVVSNAAEADDCSAVYSILSDLEKIQSVVKVDDRSVFLPIKLDEGLMVNILNCAARYGESVLADKAWDMLNTSLRLPYLHEIRAEIEYHAEAADDPQEVEEEEVTPSPEPSAESASGDAEQNAVPEVEQPTEAPLKQVDFSDVSSNWEEILQDKLHNDRVPMMSCYHAYIEAQAKGGQIEKAFDAVRQLEENYPDNEKALSASQGLSMLADELAKDANTVDQAFFLLDQWHSQGKSITTPMLDVVVAACSRMGDANRAFETFEAYARLGVKQRTDSYNVLMEVCAQNKQVEVIMKLVQEMTKAGVKPNVDTYMQIIEGYINNSDTSGITHALQITRREGFKPTLKILERASACADQHNDIQAKQAIKREMIEAGYRFSLQVRQRAPGGGGRGRGRYGPGGGRGRSGTTYLGPRQSSNPNFRSGNVGGQPSDSQLGPSNVQGSYFGDRNQGGYTGGYQGPQQGNYQSNTSPAGYQGNVQPGYQGGMQPGYQGSPQSGYQSGMQPGYQGGPQSGYQGGMQSGYQGGMQPGYQGGPQPGYQGGMQSGYQGGPQPGHQGGLQSGYQGAAQSSYQGGMQPGHQGGIHFGYQGGRVGYQQNTGSASPAATQVSIDNPDDTQVGGSMPTQQSEMLGDPTAESRVTESLGKDPSSDAGESPSTMPPGEAMNTSEGGAENHASKDLTSP